VLGGCGFIFRIRRQWKEKEEESGVGVVAETKVMALLGQQEMRSRQYPEALVSSSGLFGRLLNTGL